MKDYIERATTIEAFTEAERKADCPGADFPVIKRMLANLPAADVAEVRHGTWTDIGSLSCRCSECGCKNNRTTPYCPWCGARMNKEKQR